MLSLREIFLRLTVAAVLGAIIGIERELRRRPAGIRTSCFVCLATALFTILSAELARLFGDTSSTRIASNIVNTIVPIVPQVRIVDQFGNPVSATTVSAVTSGGGSVVNATPVSDSSGIASVGGWRHRSAL